MSYKNHISIEFSVNVDENNKIDLENFINKPIIVNDLPIGVITDAKLDESGLYYNCLGIIWDKFFKPEFSCNYSNLNFESIRIGENI